MVALTATPSLVDRLVLLSPAGLVGARVTWRVLSATIPWLLVPSPRTAARLLRVMSASAVTPRAELVSWMAMVPKETRATGAPKPLPRAVIERWRGHNTAVIIGERDCFFPPTEVHRASEEHLGTDVIVLPNAGHLIVDDASAQVASLTVTS
jgi:pimeloyl-ACP methyl ester carboxylesterase